MSGLIPLLKISNNINTRLSSSGASFLDSHLLDLCLSILVLSTLVLIMLFSTAFFLAFMIKLVQSKNSLDIFYTIRTEDLSCYTQKERLLY